MMDNFKKAAVVAAKANDVVVHRLISGATTAFREFGLGQDDVDVFRVAGAMEIPLALNTIAAHRIHQMFVVVGAVIKGETDHYHHVSTQCHNGVQTVALKYGLNLGNGILNVQTIEQALARADGTHGNIGKEAACAAIDLYQLAITINQSKKSL